MPSMTGRLVRSALRSVRHALRRRLRPRVPGRFQPYNHTLPDRYPWLFDVARRQLQDIAAPDLLSFGCSRGDEVFTLRRYFPAATIRGIDIDPANIAACEARATEGDALSFAVGATTAAEPDGRYDAIFCLAVLCHGDLTISGARRSDPLLRFADFERVVTDLARCLKPGGLLFLHTTSFRFCDTQAAAGFVSVFEARPDQLAPDVLFDRDNRLMPGMRYRPVAFRKLP
jgi:2-polyprenyl-3-methyl-5-hydroxy-6-metoxy-1,4-benzoquinol methylase